MKQDWRRIPLPKNKESLAASASLGRRLAALLNTETEVLGVTGDPVSKSLRAIGNLDKPIGGGLDIGDLEVRANWGYQGQNGAVMPCKGRAVERDYTVEERATLGESIALLGEKTFDIYLNNLTCWRNVPARVWDYTMGGYQVVKKWLSYREMALLGRSLTIDETREVMKITRRITSLLLMEPELDTNYSAVKADAFAWKQSEPPL